MQAQTYSLLAALASTESIELLIALLEEEITVEELVRQTGISSSTASRRLDALALTGLVSRASPRGAYAITCPEETRRLLDTLSDLALAVLEKRRLSELRLQKRVTRTRLHAESESEAEGA